MSERESTLLTRIQESGARIQELKKEYKEYKKPAA
jgi:hypothetical protein